MARALGAEVSATAGSPAKRAVVRRLGLRAAADSRSIAFASDLATAAEGRAASAATTGAAGYAPADFVLNSLTSPGMVAASLAGLVPGGALAGACSLRSVAGALERLKLHTPVCLANLCSSVLLCRDWQARHLECGTRGAGAARRAVPGKPG